MISILIPVFDRDVTDLVQSLSEQLQALGKSSEIIVLDDGSDSQFKTLNHKIRGLPFVQYSELDSNIGRIKIRQKLAAAAVYEWLLFLDCDSMLVSKEFLKTYFNLLTPSTPVIVGGRIYSITKPADCSLALHWKYGSAREVASFKHKGRTNRFMTNNVMIRKHVFETINFDGGWKGYGYEDTWMGIQLSSMAVPITFINNPVLHEGVEQSTAFIAKSEEALNNLRLLAAMVSPLMLARHVKLFNYFYMFRSAKMLWIAKLLYFILQVPIKRNLLSCNPSIKAFDLYRLNYFITVAGSDTKTTRT